MLRKICFISYFTALLLWHVGFSLNIFLPVTNDISIILESIRDQLRQPFFMEIIVRMCWAIWIMRNDIIFKNIAHSVQRCKAVFRKKNCSNYSKSKSTSSSTYRSMARRLCVTLAIFFLTFYVS